MTTRRIAILFIGVAISALLLWLAGRDVALEDVLLALRDANPWAVLPFTLCLLVFYVIRTYRWKILLSPLTDARTRDLFGPVMIGYGGNFILPFQLGEVARTVAAMHRTRMPFMSIAFSILVERVFDFLIILAALSISLATHPELPSYVADVGTGVGIAVAAAIVFLVVFAVRPRYAVDAVERLAGFLPPRLRTLLVDQLSIGAEGLRSLRSRRVLIAAAVTSIAQWTFIAICVWISFWAIGSRVPVSTTLLIVALIVLGSSIPTAPGYLGSFQAGYVVGIGAIGGDPVQAISASIFYHVIYAVSALSLGLIAVRRSRLPFNRFTKKTAEPLG